MTERGSLTEKRHLYNFIFVFKVCKAIQDTSVPCFWRIFRGPFDALKCAPVYKSSKTKVFKPASLCSRGLFLPHTYHSVSRFIEVILSDRNLHLNMKKEKQIKKGSVVVLWLLLLSHSKKAGGFLCWVFLFFQCLRFPSTKKCIL